MRTHQGRVAMVIVPLHSNMTLSNTLEFKELEKKINNSYGATEDYKIPKQSWGEQNWEHHNS